MSNIFSLFNRLSLKDQSAFTKRLAFLIKANVPILESLQMLKGQNASRRMGRMMDKVIADVSNGQPLSASLAKHKNVFSPFVLNIMRVGEEGGILDSNLEYLAVELNKQQELKKKVIGSLIYPSFIIFSTLAVASMIALYVFPKIIPIFKTINLNLPLTTKILIWGTDTFNQHWMAIFLSVFLAGAFLTFLYKTFKPFTYLFIRIALKMPIVGRMVKSYQMANFCRTLGLLLNCQISIVPALKITADATSNVLYRREFHALSEQVLRGKKIASHLDGQPSLFPKMVPELISIGETVGNLGDTLVYLSDYYEGEVSDITKNLASSIEPVLLSFMGVIVGFIAVSVITPIYELTANIHP